MFDSFCAFADTATLDATPRTPFSLPMGNVGSYGVRSGGVRGVINSAGAAIGDLFVDQQRIKKLIEAIISLNGSFLEDEKRALDTDSVGGLLMFMARHRDARMPLLGAESSGKLVATWDSRDECLSIRFIGDAQIHYAITTKNGDQVVRRWGDSSVATFLGEHKDAERLVSN